MALRAVVGVIFLVQLALHAEPIVLNEAVTAAENWIASGEAMGTELSAQSVGAQTYTDEAGADAVHVIALAGGGFVVTSTDDEMEPILAYSGTGTFNVDEGSPIVALLDADVRARKAAIGQNGNGGLRLMAAASVSVNDEANDNKSKWDRLLGRNAVRGLRLMSASGLPTVSTVCVAPLIQSKWSQGKVSTGPCYNYYTPNGYVCGCVATAMAQVMRYHQYPTSYVSPKTVECTVDGVSQSLTMNGGCYDWSNMPLNPSSANETQRKAIGKLTYDCGVSVGMDYASDGSGASMEDAKKAMTGTFGYYSADYKLWPVLVTFHNLVTNDLHQARPVLLGITGKGAHAIVADGYGFSSGALYYHLNMGWGGQDDLWYNLPTVTTSSYSYNVIQDLVYNIKPTKNTGIKRQTLEEALDNTSLRFTTGGDAEWYYQSDKTHDGEDAVRSGKIGNSQYTWMRTTVEGSGEISFWWKCDTGKAWWGSDDVDFKIDGKKENRINGAEDWRKVTKKVKGNGVHTLDWVYTKDSDGAVLSRADCVWVDQVEWKPMVTVTLDAQGGTVASNELFLARNDYNGYGYNVLPTPTWVNRTFLGWYTAKVGGTRVYYWSTTPAQDMTLYAHWQEDRYWLWDDDWGSWLYLYTGGDAQWTEVTTPTYSGSYAFKSGTIGHGKTTWMEKEVSGPGRLTFCWKPSSEANCDVCVFSVNDEDESRISGVSNEWSYVSCTIDETGSHTFRWTYSKDGNTVKGSDCVWVDSIKWQPQVSVTLDGNGGATYGWTSWGVTKYVDDYFAYLPSPTRTGYRFDGWFTMRNGGVRVDANTVVSEELSVLYAHWLKEEPLADVLDTTLSVTTGGSAIWFGQTTVSHDGTGAACSGRLSYGQSNWMEMSVTGAGRIRFLWAIDGYTYSSATYSDSLTFMTNGIEAARIVGQHDWTNCTFTVGSGTHKFRWLYSKNGFSSVGADCAWVDGVVWEPEAWVFFKPEGGVLSQTWCRRYVGDEVSLPTPVRDGYNFEGWFTEEDGGARVDGTSFVLDRTRWLYARWSFTGLSARDYRNESVYLTWGLSPEAALYSIYRSTTDDLSDANWLVDRTYKWYFDYAAASGVDYWYWVVAVDADGNLAYSDAVSGRREVSLSLGADEMSHDVLAGSEAVAVYANASWQAVSSAAWLELTTSSGNGNGVLSYAFAHNFSKEARDATITVTAGGETAHPKTLTIYVSQSGWIGGVSMESDEYGVLAGVPLLGSEIVPEVADGYALSVTGLPSGLKFDAKNGTITGVPTAKAGAYTVTFTATPNAALKKAGAIVETATIKINVSYPVLTLETEAWGDESAAGTVKGGGAIAANKKVTLTATPAKGCVFAGWFKIGDGEGEEEMANGESEALVSMATPYSYLMPAKDTTLVARFVTAEEDRNSIELAVDGVEMAAGAGRPPYQTNIWAGVYLEWPVAADALSETNVKVAGLPSGLKFTDKPVTSKIGSGKTAVTVTNVPAYTIYGAPTAASKVDTKTGAVKPSAVKVTVTTASKAKVVYEIDVTVDAMKEWAVGTFDGVSGDGRDGARPSQDDADAQERVPPEGLVTLTVAANGKISGKLIDADGTWTLSATSFDSYDAESETYVATVIGKNGKMAFTNEVVVSAEEMAAAVAGQPPYRRGVVSGWATSEPPVEWTAWQNLWKTEPWKTEVKPFAKAPTLAIDAGTRDACPYLGTITLKFAASGAVTASGKFVTGQDARGKDIVYSASCSSVLVPEADAAGAGRPPYRIFLYFPPKAGKFEGYADEVSLMWDGVGFTVE